ncbi:Axonemal dynein light chain, putative [Angomonas deanei]|uniref:Axonemal dynein light chain, putative n=1 Tax=Angomonas deanei TaxID=59799 RepID=A0A7G2CNZ6_9TRYP|nr:Axonemal dynein light chain, putative [Angomonas deanei]
MTTAAPSLVKYETPTLLTDVKHKKTQKETTKKAAPVSSDDILYSILPPREYEDKGKWWIQYPSSTPATRLDAINLQEQLDQLLVERQARETGVCPIREELYGQAFDELIRQVTVSCAERGLLLLRVRDELRMTLDAYRSLYESSTAYGVRKALQEEQSKVELEARVRALEREKEELQRQVSDLEQECDRMEDEERARREEEERKHTEEVAFFRRTYETLSSNLQTVVNPTKS